MYILSLKHWNLKDLLSRLRRVFLFPISTIPFHFFNELCRKFPNRYKGTKSITWNRNLIKCHVITLLSSTSKKKKEINSREFCEWWSLLPCCKKKPHCDILSELNIYPVYPKAIEKCPESVLQSCSPPCWHGKLHGGYMAMCQGALTDYSTAISRTLV